MQIISGIGLLGGGNDGVAYAAHIGGFIAAMLLIHFFNKNPPKQMNRRSFSGWRIGEEELVSAIPRDYHVKWHIADV